MLGGMQGHNEGGCQGRRMQGKAHLVTMLTGIGIPGCKSGYLKMPSLITLMIDRVSRLRLQSGQIIRVGAACNHSTPWVMRQYVKTPLVFSPIHLSPPPPPPSTLSGAMKYLAEHYDLTKVHMTGASGGSLAAVLAACGVPADLVLRRAYELSVEYGVWERPLGLTGVWGGLVERWLDELLPVDAHELCRGRVTVVVTTLPDMRQVRLGTWGWGRAGRGGGGAGRVAAGRGP